MRTKWLFVILLAKLLCGCALKGPPPPRLDVSIADMRVKNIGVMEQTCELQLRVQNPNNFDIETMGCPLISKLMAKPLPAPSATDQSPYHG